MSSRSTVYVCGKRHVRVRRGSCRCVSSSGFGRAARDGFPVIRSTRSSRKWRSRRPSAADVEASALGARQRRYSTALGVVVYRPRRRERDTDGRRRLGCSLWFVSPYAGRFEYRRFTRTVVNYFRRNAVTRHNDESSRLSAEDATDTVNNFFQFFCFFVRTIHVMYGGEAWSYFYSLRHA